MPTSVNVLPDIENQNINLYKYINLMELFDLYIKLYYNESFLISRPYSYGQIVPHTFTFNLEQLIDQNFETYISSKNFPLLKCSYITPIYTLLTPKKIYKDEWFLGQFSKMDKYIYKSDIIQDKDTYTLQIKLLNDNFKRIPFRHNEDLNKYKIDNVFTPLKLFDEQEYFKRINCNILCNIEIPQENIVIDYTLETFLKRKRFTNLDELGKDLLVIDGKLIMILDVQPPLQNVFDTGLINDIPGYSGVTYKTTNDVNISPLKNQFDGLQKNELYYYRQGIDRLLNNEFLIDGDVFDKENRINVFIRDNDIRFFYNFHKFNSDGYPEFMVICEVLVENMFVYQKDEITMIEKNLEDVYIKLLSYDFSYPIENLLNYLKEDKPFNINIENFEDKNSVNIGNSKIQIKNWKNVYLTDFDKNTFEHGNLIYKNIVLSSYVWSKSQQSSQIGNTIFQRDIIQDKNPTYLYKSYFSFYSWLKSDFEYPLRRYIKFSVDFSQPVIERLFDVSFPIQFYTYVVLSKNLLFITYQLNEKDMELKFSIYSNRLKDLNMFNLLKLNCLKNYTIYTMFFTYHKINVLLYNYFSIIQIKNIDIYLLTHLSNEIESIQEYRIYKPMEKEIIVNFETIPYTPLEIIEHPETQLVEENSDVTISVKVKGGQPPYTFRWQKNGEDI